MISCSNASSDKYTRDLPAAASGGLIKHARGFQIYDKGAYRLLAIFNPFHTGGDTIQYALLKKGQKRPEGFPPDRIISVPVQSIAVTSNLHVGAIERLEAWDFLLAVGDGSQLYSKMVRKKIQEGAVSEIQKGGKLNEEKIIELQPDVLMVTGTPDEGLDAYTALTRSGVPVMINSEWMENSPLGRAEWIKLTAALLDRLNFADHQFAFVEANYRELAANTGAVKHRPGVLLGNEFQGTWHMPGGNSFMAHILADAGAEYHWKDNDQTGAIPLSYESVYPVALEADVWLNIYVPALQGSKEMLLSSDSRYAEFKSVKNNELYTFNKRTDENGANDYWESAPYRPDLLLADYIRILHPDLLPDHALYYCQKLD